MVLALRPGDIAEYFGDGGRGAGNSNRGHDGAAYGTELPAADKDAIVEYLKTF